MFSELFYTEKWRFKPLRKNDSKQEKSVKTRNSKWTDKTIRKAIECFIDENGRPPKVRELDRYEWLPPHPSIKNRRLWGEVRK